MQSKYIVGATYDTYSSFIQVTENGYLGATYVLDTNPFEESGRLLEDGNTCENRLSSSYDGKSFLSDFWDYTLYSKIAGNLGNDL